MKFSLKNIALAGVAINLLWGAETYKPPNFLGHSVATPQSTVRVVAMPEGGASPSGWDFRWWKDGQYLSRSSGPGKTTLTFNADRAGTKHQIILKVNDQSGAAIAEAQTTVPVENPRLVVYQNDPLSGINYGAAIGSLLTLLAPQVNLFAEPYYFPNADVAGRKIDYVWKLNDEKVVADPADGRRVTFASPADGGAGENTISVNAESQNNIFQTAAQTFKIKFGAGQEINF